MKKTFFISTAIDYPNAKPHIGHAYEKVLADAIARFKRLQGYDVHFSTGTDEHGLKIQRKAEENGKSPKEFVDEMSAHFKELCDKLGVSYDDFIRTTEKRHEKVAQEIFKKLTEKGEIYKGQYEGLYCVGCETFYAEKDLEDGKCPIHGKKLEKVDEENYFFKMNEYREKLIEHIKSNKNYIIPEAKRNEILNRLEENLNDLSVSRSSFNWGIPVPGDSGHVQYVWMDALLNYISTIDYPNEKFKKYWPADVHLIGKDIVWHHTVIWGSILMALGIELPKTVMVHGFINVEGQKMSKSLGNVVDPMKLLEKYDPDMFRYYMISQVPTFDDGDFSEKRLIEKTNNELIANFGNFVYRTLSFLKANFDSTVPDKGKFGEEEEKIVKKTQETKEKMEHAMEDYNLRSAFQSALELASEGNKYFQEKQPWVSKKEDMDDCKTTMYVAVNLVKTLSTLFWPFTPFASERIWEQLNMKGPIECSGLEATEMEAGHKIGEIEPLFKKIE